MSTITDEDDPECFFESDFRERKDRWRGRRCSGLIWFGCVFVWNGTFWNRLYFVDYLPVAKRFVLSDYTNRQDDLWHTHKVLAKEVALSGWQVKQLEIWGKQFPRMVKAVKVTRKTSVRCDYEYARGLVGGGHCYCRSCNFRRRRPLDFAEAGADSVRTG